jgi:hypothetical protein
VREGDPGRSDRPIYVSVDNQRKRSTRGVDGAIFELARRQHGVFGRGQLIALGLSESNIEYRLLAGRLQILYRGVYGLGSPGSKLARWMAAVLAAGPGAVLSHRSAAELWGLLDGFTRPIHVTVPSARRGRPGIRFHRSILPDDERTVFEGIPVTTVPRTFVDCAPGMSARRLERMINEADVLRLYDHLSVPDLLHRYPGRSGSRALWKALQKRNAGTTRTRTELEERFLELVDELGLPRPEINVPFVLDGAHRDRRPLARRTCRSRARQQAVPRHRARVRARSAPRPQAQRGGLAPPQDHLAPARRRAHRCGR